MQATIDTPTPMVVDLSRTHSPRKVRAMNVSILTRENPIVLAESDGVRWLHIMSQADYSYGGEVIPFGDAAFFDQVFADLRDQIEGGVHQPSLVTDSLQLGHQTGPNALLLGTGVRVRRVT